MLLLAVQQFKAKKKGKRKSAGTGQQAARGKEGEGESSVTSRVFDEFDLLSKDLMNIIVMCPFFSFQVFGRKKEEEREEEEERREEREEREREKRRRWRR